jgi:hypothetical protein
VQVLHLGGISVRLAELRVRGLLISDGSANARQRLPESLALQLGRRFKNMPGMPAFDGKVVIFMNWGYLGPATAALVSDRVSQPLARRRRPFKHFGMSCPGLFPRELLTIHPWKRSLLSKWFNDSGLLYQTYSGLT